MFFLTPRYLKQGRQFVKDARKLVAFKRDLYSPEVVAGVEGEIANLEETMRTRDRAAVEAQMHRLDQACGTITQPVADAAWRENVEVFLVAIVIALAVRTYFLQPFTIPTGSMQPTLNGIIGVATPEPAPNVLTQAVHLGLFGRNYVNVVARAQEQIVDVNEANRGGLGRFLTYTRIETSANNTYWVWGNRSTVAKLLEGQFNREFKPGEVILRGYINTGDHVFVDKVTYNFRNPHRGEVFVFSTHGIQKMRDAGLPTQYYIKRLGGLPNDTLRIASPKLYVNGELAQESGFGRVMSGDYRAPQNGYRGYGNGAESGGNIHPMQFLTNPDDPFRVPPHAYFALGDNSYNSSDSRDWGIVPEENLMGRAVFVYWPFNTHWSLIR